MKNNHWKNLFFAITPYLPANRPAAGILLPLLLLFACAGVGSAQVGTFHINEIESSGGVPDDWIEFTNTGTASIDVTGWEVLDNDNNHAFYVFPSGSTIAPKGFLVVDISPFF